MQQNVNQIEYSTLKNCRGRQNLKMSVKYIPGWLGMSIGNMWFDCVSAFSCQNQRQYETRKKSTAVDVDYLSRKIFLIRSVPSFYRDGERAMIWVRYWSIIDGKYFFWHCSSKARFEKNMQTSLLVLNFRHRWHCHGIFFVMQELFELFGLDVIFRDFL